MFVVKRRGGAHYQGRGLVVDAKLHAMVVNPHDLLSDENLQSNPYIFVARVPRTTLINPHARRRSPPVCRNPTCSPCRSRSVGVTGAAFAVAGFAAPGHFWRGAFVEGNLHTLRYLFHSLLWQEAEGPVDFERLPSQ